MVADSTSIALYATSDKGYGTPADWAGYFDGKVYFSDNVGIGATSPSSKLEINEGASNGLSLNVSDILFVNDTSGRLGIGTTDPGADLDVSSVGQTKIRVKTTDGAGVPALWLRNDNTAVDWEVRLDPTDSDKFK